jgi:hypothetical protein
LWCFKKSLKVDYYVADFLLVAAFDVSDSQRLVKCEVHLIYEAIEW